jgi:hypothetical protein
MRYDGLGATAGDVLFIGVQKHPQDRSITGIVCRDLHSFDMEFAPDPVP